MAFMKVVYVGHFRGTQALEVSQTRHKKFTVIEELIADRYESRSRQIRNRVARLETVRKECR
jgi:hypothetical protein